MVSNVFWNFHPDLVGKILTVRIFFNWVVQPPGWSLHWGLCRWSLHSFSWSCYRSCSGGWNRGILRGSGGSGLGLSWYPIDPGFTHLVVMVISGGKDEQPRCEVTSDFSGWNKKWGFWTSLDFTVRSGMSVLESEPHHLGLPWDVTNIGSRIRH